MSEHVSEKFGTEKVPLLVSEIFGTRKISVSVSFNFLSTVTHWSELIRVLEGEKVGFFCLFQL